MIVAAKALCKTYMQGKLEVPVLHDVNLSMEEGEYLSIMGPSGSGKSTLMNLLGCLDVPTSGEYLLNGFDVTKQNDKQMAMLRNKYIGFIFQQFNLMPRSTALDNVALPLLFAGIKKAERKERAAAALEKVGLADRMGFLPTQLSGGQCQRVAIARAIVTQPKLLLADEPTGALDTASGRQVMELFRQLNDEGATILMITHEREIALCAKRISHIRDGILSDEEEGGRL